MLAVAPNLQFIADLDGAVILDNARNKITTLDPMGGYIWHELQRGKSPDVVIQSIVDATGEPVSVVDRDVREFVDELITRKLVLRLADSLDIPEAQR